MGQEEHDKGSNPAQQINLETKNTIVLWTIVELKDFFLKELAYIIPLESKTEQ